MKPYFTCEPTVRADEPRTEREVRSRIAAGYSFRITAGRIGVVDYVHSLEMKKRMVSDYGEGGLRMQLTPLLVGAVGGGGGVARSRDEPIGRATVAFTYFVF